MLTTPHRMPTSSSSAPRILLLLAALTVSLTMPPARQEWLVWIAWVPWLAWLGERRSTFRSALKGTFFLGTIYHVVLLAPFLSLGWWGWGEMDEATLHTMLTGQRIFMAVLVGAVALWGGVLLAAVGWLIRPWLGRALYSVWIVPSAWVLVECLGRQAVFGSTWGVLGYRLHDHQVLRQVASLTGIYGLSFLILLVNTVIASWLIAFRRHVRGPMVATLLAMGVLVWCLSYGHRTLRATAGPKARVRVALLQSTPSAYTSEDLTVDGLDRRYHAMVQEAMGHGADLVVLPETVWLRTLQLDDVPSPQASNLISRSVMQAQITQWLSKGQAHVILGVDAAEAGRVYNTATLWAPDSLVGVYRKRRLVPFSEYRPALLGRLAPRNRLHEEGFAYTPGTGSQLIRMGSLILGLFICQEVTYPSLVRASVRDGATLLVTTGNDGVFRSRIVAEEQTSAAQFRAAEHRRYVVRSMKSGISAVIDPWGRIIASAPFQAQGVVHSAIAARDEMTFYTRYGDWIVWCCALCVLLPLSARRLYKPKPLPYNNALSA